MALQTRYLLAALIALTYLVFCVMTALTYRRAQRRQQAQWAGAGAGNSDAATVLLAFASQTGTAERLALQSAQSLRAGGMAVRVLPLDQLQEDDLLHEDDLLRRRLLLFVVSTTGEGDAPDMAATLAQRMAQPSPGAPLPQLQFGVLALGDRSYQQYCAFGYALHAWLGRRHAQPLFDVIDVDNGDDGALRHWQHQLGVLSGHSDEADWSAPAYGRWRLAQRQLLNPGSAGGAVYHLQLTPLDLPAPSWQAGDIAEIGPRNSDQAVQSFIQALGLQNEMSTLAPVLASRLLPHEAAALQALRGLSGADLLARLKPLPHRAYSIASLPADGGLELMVRLMHQPDGRAGIGSGWLGLHAAPGQEIDLRVRVNTAFHGPQDDRPLILIGNGTGLAGLRAHLRQRIAAGQRRNWLLFGERSHRHDFFHGDELQGWLAEGHLQRLDLAFSRDQAQRVYVQDKLREAAAELQQWVEQGASLYVCGSLQGMAAGVTLALQEILGEAALQALAEQGRYRRDVY
ncbi:sulfite reductase subunit alpha [Herbaspirillum sp. BH-1]|uniref:NADPH--hemoprotein reductase n=1 Tax=Herbaspirillum frisingense TaxID=92645 RepID=A0ABU1PKM3_9BURK|nr:MULTISPECIES: sulfite reductase subunit alpha [Herbaspirillum]MDR6586464.1 sulfite reductase (NADPH) flavoprotein alpha-component [Herbaspirillum frisingense]PLY61619.1 sulfite reductase subunit alpha [Herbaspirillum sp. BH-1]